MDSSSSDPINVFEMSHGEGCLLLGLPNFAIGPHDIPRCGTCGGALVGETFPTQLLCHTQSTWENGVAGDQGESLPGALFGEHCLRDQE